MLVSNCYGLNGGFRRQIIDYFRVEVKPKLPPIVISAKTRLNSLFVLSLLPALRRLGFFQIDESIQKEQAQGHDLNDLGLICGLLTDDSQEVINFLVISTEHRQTRFNVQMSPFQQEKQL